MIYVFKNVLILRILIGTLVYFARKLITNTNNSRIFQKMLNYVMLYTKKSTTGIQDSPMYSLLGVKTPHVFTTGELRFPVVFITKESYYRGAYNNLQRVCHSKN
jgi:hypothetical protein